MNNNIIFRADGNNKIGMGHIIRCIALAHEIQLKEAINIHFIIKKDCAVAIQLIQNSGFITEPFKSNIEIKNILMRVKPILIINDIVFSSIQYMNLVKRYAYTINYDDLGSGSKYANILIHATAKRKKGIPKNVKYYFGPKYLLLSQPFVKIRKKRFIKKINDCPNKILILMGGSDPKNITKIVLKSLNKIDKRLIINIILGPSYLYSTKLEKEIHSSIHQINIKNSISNQAILKLMLYSDIGVVNYGMSLFEMACVGLPAISISSSKLEINQGIVEKLGFSINLGMWNKISIQKLYHDIKNLLSNYAERKELSLKGIKYIDGHGVVRVQSIISNYIHLKH